MKTTAKRIATVTAALLAAAILAGCGGGGGGGGSGNTGGGGSPGESSSENDTALLSAALNGRANAVRRLLAAGADLNARDEDGDTPLHLAALGGDGDTVKILLDAGADVSARDDRVYWTPLLPAAARGHAGVVRQLLDAGADPNAETRDGITALDLAREGGHADIEGILRSAGGMAGSDTGMTGADSAGGSAANTGTSSAWSVRGAGQRYNAATRDGDASIWAQMIADHQRSTYGHAYGEDRITNLSAFYTTIFGNGADHDWQGSIGTAPTYEILSTKNTAQGPVTLLRVSGTRTLASHDREYYHNNNCGVRGQASPPCTEQIGAIIGVSNFGVWGTQWSEFAYRSEGLAGGRDVDQIHLHPLTDSTNLLVKHSYNRVFDIDGVVRFPSLRPGNGEIWSATYNGFMTGVAHNHDDRPVTGDVRIEAEFDDRRTGVGSGNRNNTLESIDIAMTDINGDGFTIAPITFPTIDGTHPRAPDQPPGTDFFGEPIIWEGTGHAGIPSFSLDQPEYYVAGAISGPAYQHAGGIFSTGDVTGAFGALRDTATNLPTEPYTRGTGQR